jgi:hypothetical protein
MENNYYYKYNIRNQYNLLIRNNEYEILLNYLYNSFIIKENQYKLLFEFNKYVNLPNKSEEKEDLYLTYKKLNKICYLDTNNFTRLNIEYIAGLFDAEGCFYINKNKFTSYNISLTQKNHPIILEEIIKILGFGKLYQNVLKIYKKSECLAFIQLIKNHLIIKYNQAISFETFLLTIDINVKENMYSICNKEKHEIELFNDLNQSDIGKDGYMEILKWKNIKIKICKEINLKQIYKEKSEKMKGEGNHNFGKIFSEDTKKKMSASIINAKRALTDETILEVRNLLKNDGVKNIDIQKKLGLPRHTITRIKNGDIVCKNEEKINKVHLTHEEVNLSKRKISTDEIIIVIEKIINNWKPIEILDYLNGIRIKYNEKKLSIDIIKNIKRNLKNEKHILYESELSKEKYDYYLLLINNFTYNINIIK